MIRARRSRYAATCWRLPQLPVSQNILDRLRDMSSSTASQSGAAQIFRRRSSPARIRSARAIAISAPIRWASGSLLDARCRCHSGISACRVSHGAARVSLSSALTCPTRRSSSSATPRSDRPVRAAGALRPVRRRPGRGGRSSPRQRGTVQTLLVGELFAVHPVGVDQPAGRAKCEFRVMTEIHLTRYLPRQYRHDQSHFTRYNAG